MTDTASDSTAAGDTLEAATAVSGIAYLGTQAYGVYAHTPFWLERDNNMTLERRVGFLTDNLRHPSAYVAGPRHVYDDAKTSVNDFLERRRARQQRQELELQQALSWRGSE